MSGEAGPSSHTESRDAAHQFFMESHRIATEAQFIIDSLPTWWSGPLLCMACTSPSFL